MSCLARVMPIVLPRRQPATASSAAPVARNPLRAAYSREWARSVTTGLAIPGRDDRWPRSMTGPTTVDRFVLCDAGPPTSGSEAAQGTLLPRRPAASSVDANKMVSCRLPRRWHTRLGCRPGRSLRLRCDSADRNTLDVLGHGRFRRRVWQSGFPTRTSPGAR
jgi:hypothetical protein